MNPRTLRKMVVVRKPSAPVAVEPVAVEPVVQEAPVVSTSVVEEVVETPVAVEAPEVTPDPIAEFLSKIYSEVVNQINSGAWDAHITELHAYESNNKKRKSVLSALGSRKSPTQA